MNDLPQGRPDLPPGMTGYVPPYIPQPNGPYNLPPKKTSPPANAFSIASMVMGILSVLSLCLVYFTPFFAGLAILFAILSKGYEKGMHGFSLAGIISSSIALSVDVLMIAFAFVFVFQTMQHPEQMSPEFWRTYKEMGEDFYGDSFDDMLKDMYGEDFDIDNYIK